MNEEIETKEVVYHVLSGLAKRGFFELREGMAENIDERRVQEAKKIMSAGSSIYKELSDHMTSPRGAYELSASVAACLAGGWVAAHADELKKDDLDVRRKEDLDMDLFNISNAVIKRVYDKEGRTNFDNIQEAVSLGFLAGTQLGEHILHATPHVRMSSQKMLEILSNLNKTPNFSPSFIQNRGGGR